MDHDQIKRIAVGAAYKGAKILRSYFGKLTRIDKKGMIDLVTEADLASERQIIAEIKSAYPDHTILAEESGLSAGQDTHTWIIDPLDGTTNYAHGLDLYAISIAFAYRDEVVMGLVLDPARAELFTAQKGSGTELNGRQITVSDVASLKESLVVTGFPYDVHRRMGPTMQRFEGFLYASQGVRRLGAAALDLAYVACGRFDAFWEENLQPWDTAAGALLVAEAGGRVSDYQNARFHHSSKEILASNNEVHNEMIDVLRSADEA